MYSTSENVPYKIYLPGIFEPLIVLSGISKTLTVVELLIKFPVFYGTVRFIAFFACPFLGPYKCSSRRTTLCIQLLPFHQYSKSFLSLESGNQNFPSFFFLSHVYVIIMCTSSSCVRHHHMYVIIMCTSSSPNSCLFVFVTYYCEDGARWRSG